MPPSQTKKAGTAVMEWYWPSSVDELDLPGYHPVTFGDPVLIGQAVELSARIVKEMAAMPIQPPVFAGNATGLGRTPSPAATRTVPTGHANARHNA